ncbi:MAG: putative DNA binding domain-containing protein [Candidatus Omnitrophica bacterium]|nr:putative DNA binding domain-containing protein [Candidatus Omnitrophota bacterium]
MERRNVKRMDLLPQFPYNFSQLMKTKSLTKIIGTSESAAIEWKPSLSQIHEIIETVVAFANTEGGRLFVGVSKEGIVKGVSIGKDTIESLANRIAQHTEPKVQPRMTVTKVEGKEIIVIDVKESRDKLVLASGRPYVRVGKSTRQMSKEEYEDRILNKHKTELNFDSQTCQGAKIADISRAKIFAFIQKAKQERGLDINPNAALPDILSRLKLTTKDKKITNAAVLLFGKDPQKFFLQAELKAVRFRGYDVTGEMTDFKTITEDAITLLERAESFIFDHIPMKAWIESGKLQRQEKWLYPPKAIREALANALAHRDYKSTGRVQVRIFDDRMEIWNPGKLPSGLTVETLKETHDSIPTNPSIAKAFFWIRYAEEVGTGTNKIVRWCKKWGLSEPKFEERGSSFVVTFRKAPETVHREVVKTGVKTRVKTRVKARGKILDAIKQNPQITVPELCAVVGLTQKGVEWNIKRLKDEGLLRRVGPAKGGHWEVSASV